VDSARSISTDRVVDLALATQPPPLSLPSPPPALLRPCIASVASRALRRVHRPGRLYHLTPQRPFDPARFTSRRSSLPLALHLAPACKRGRSIAFFPRQSLSRSSICPIHAAEQTNRDPYSPRGSSTRPSPTLPASSSRPAPLVFTMDRNFASSLLGLAAFSTLLLSIQPAGAADWQYPYCSSLNTGEQDTSYTWPYQSNGNCTNHCKEEGGSWAFAVIQFTDCWCSNYVPGDTSDTSDCMVNCPGFPDEKCGNKDKDLYIYVQMDGKPSGTKGASQPSSTPAASSKQQAPTSKKPSPTDTPSKTQEPVTVPTLVTESGNVVTRTVVITPTAAAPAVSESKDSPNIGAIAGGVAGGVIGLLAILGAILFFLWRKRRQQQLEQEGGSGITRNVSTMSRAGLLGRTEKSPTPLTTTFGSQRSRPDDESTTPITPSTRRLSQPILVDSRLNPAAVLTFHGANLSRESLGSIDDSRDYGRQLNVRNPDP
jgi:cell wall integrity and stress response component